MRWSISKELDGVITDDPKKFLEVSKDWENGKRDIKFTRRQWVIIFWINFMVLVFGGIFYWKHGSEDKRKEKKTSSGEKGESIKKVDASQDQ